MLRGFLCRGVFGTLLALCANVAFAFPLVIAQVSDRPKKDFKQLRPMVEYMAQQLAPYGVTSGSVRLYDSLDKLVVAVRSGEVHWVTETGYSAAVLVHEANASLLAHKWKGGKQSYQSVIYTHKDSGVKTINDLVGKVMAFEHNTSFSSYYLPRNALEKEGLRFAPLVNHQAPVPEGQVGFVFSRNEKNNALWTDKQLVAAGVLNDGDWENPKRVPPEIKKNLNVIYRSPLYPRALELGSPTLPAPLATALSQALLSLNEENAKKLLKAYEKTTKFQAIGEDVPSLLSDIYTSSRSW